MIKRALATAATTTAVLVAGLAFTAPAHAQDLIDIDLHPETLLWLNSPGFGLININL